MKEKGQQVISSKLMTWHTASCEGLIKMGSHLPYHDIKWGRFTPERRFNVDQVPMPLPMTTKQLRKSIYRKPKSVTYPGSGLDKCQCTLQVCISPESKVRIAIIFGGSGKRISAYEIKVYDPDVDVYWLEKAWADTKFSVKWVRQTLKERTKPLEGKEFVLFCDNLTAQVSKEFLQAVREINGIVWFAVTGATDIWQPVYRGIGLMLKQTVSRIQY